MISITNPTEIDSNRAAAGDDAVKGNQVGYRLKLQTYDWNNRPLVTTKQDGTTRLIS